MKTPRMVRVNELLKREIASVLFREMAGESFDFAAVTVTQVEVSADLRHARVWVSVRGDEAAAARVLGFLHRHRGRLQDHCHRRVRLKYTPVFRFERDMAIERGDRVLALLAGLEATPAPPPPAEDVGSESGATGIPPA